MKRFFSLLTVFMLAFSLAVPASAYDFGGNNLSSTFYIDGETMDLAEYFNSPESEINFLVQVTSSTARMLSWNKDFTLYADDNDVVRISGTQNSMSLDWYSYDYANGYWLPDGALDYVDGDLVISKFSKSSIKWSTTPIYYTDGSIYFDNSSQNYCDGTSCPATDANADGICDDCGKVLRLVAPSPVLDTYSIVVKHTDGTTLRFSFTETVADTVFDAVYRDNRITVSFDNAVNHKQYKLVDGEWTDYASYPNIYDYHSINFPEGATILASDFDIYDESGELFFQSPLWTVTQGEMTGLVETLGGTMKVLVVSGVGLMACLMVLSLFGKRWLIFLR